MTGLSAIELDAKFTDRDWKRRFVQICDLVEILADCIIADDYQIPSELNAALQLSEAGVAMKDRLIRKESVPAKEAHLMTALSIGNANLFLDIDNIDPERVKNAVNAQLEAGQIHFPFTYGREFYDAFAKRHDEPKDVLTVIETSQLLSDVSPGVFQYGSLVTGPFGLLVSESGRSVRFSRRVPAYHCSDLQCGRLHPVHLTTSYEAPVNKLRSKIHDLLDADSDGADWWGFAEHITGLLSAVYSDHRAGTVVALVGDCLSDAELRALVERLLDGGSESLRTAVRPFLKVLRASDTVAVLTRAQMMQIAFLTKESDLISALDLLVSTSKIQIPTGDVRRPVIYGEVHSGAFRLQPELGNLGVRFVGGDAGFSALRERNLITKLYGEKVEEISELEWQLRHMEGDDTAERLEEFVRRSAPDDALRQLVLARRSNVIAACEYVGILDADGMDDEQIVQALLWKLGFDVPPREDLSERFWVKHHALANRTRSAVVAGVVDFDALAHLATDYFRELEGLLADSLAFATWSLLNDHVSAKYPFRYDDEADRERGFALTQEVHLNSKNETEVFDFTGNQLSLHELVRGFGILGKHLDEVRGGASGYIRDAKSLPDYHGKTDLKAFPFLHTVPFLDLTGASQDRLVGTLKSVNQSLVDANVPQVRNDFAHYRRNSPEIARMESAVEAVGRAIRDLESLGLIRVTIWRSGMSSDEWGRSKHVLIGPRDTIHVQTRPSNYDWTDLPPIGVPQYIIVGAKFAEPNEFLRVSRRYESEFSRMWAGIPNRRKPTFGGLMEGSDSSRLPAESRSAER
jgi:hypothetical protein